MNLIGGSLDLPYSGEVCFVIYPVLLWVFLEFVVITRTACSQFSKESRGKLAQRSCHLQLQTSVEKSDVRKSEVRRRWPMREMARLGR